MLKKLLKYDLFDIYRGLWPFYALVLAAAGLCRLMIPLSDDSTFLYIMSRICNGFLIAMMINAAVNNLIRIWLRFTQSIFGDESYLSHTLPVTRGQLYGSKFLSSVITMFTTVLIVAGGIFLAYFTDSGASELMTSIRLIFSEGAGMVGLSVPWFLFLVTALIVLEMICILQVGYTGILLGYRKPSARIGWSFLFGFLTYWIVQGVLVAALYALAAVRGGAFAELFSGMAVLSADAFRELFLVAVGFYTLLILMLTYFNVTVFEKGVNVD